MTYIQCTPTQPQLIAVAKLEKSALNARRTHRPDGIGELKASILAHGLMQNLVVTDGGNDTYRVIAGGRRLEAIHALQADGKLPPDYAVPCQIVTEEYALEMSLAENTIRLAMHPADQFTAFAELIDKGATAAEVAQRFGVDESLVHKRMKLARIAPDLLQEYREDGLTLECLMAFTITDDHRRQLKVFKSLQDWQKDDPKAIRAALTEKLIDASSKLARFVGVEAYLAAGGTSRSDLFSKEVYLEKPALLNKLAEKKLDGIRQELEAEGWGWIEINPERDWTLINQCSRLQPRLVDAPADLLALKSQLDEELHVIEQALEDTESDDLIDQQQAVQSRLDQVEEKLTTFIGFDAEHQALAGCFVSIGQDGTPFIDKGLVRPEQKKQLTKLLRTDDGSGEPVKTKQKGRYPESLRKDLAEDRLHVAQVELAKHPLIALDLLIFQAASAMLAVSSMPGKFSTGDGADVQFKRQRLKPSSGTETSLAGKALEDIAKSLPVDWLKPKSEAARFETFRSLSETAKLELLAYGVALTLKPKLAPAEGDEATAYDAALSLTGGSVAGYWRPARDNFLSRITRDQLLAISREVLGEPWAQSHSDEKKSLLVNQLDRAFLNPEQSGRTPEQILKLKSWLPAGMSFDIAAAPKPARSGKAKKAA
jgi:ParB family transcriptional regulator, chromosome partitioning protein